MEVRQRCQILSFFIPLNDKQLFRCEFFLLFNIRLIRIQAPLTKDILTEFFSFAILFVDFLIQILANSFGLIHKILCS